ncbi:MAG: exosortase/archaeosortase family protein [Planctomycetota bacterium]
MSSVATTDRDQLHVEASGKLRLHPLSIPLALGLFAFVPTFFRASLAWLNNLDYSHGFVVPVFAAWLVWCRKQELHSAFEQRHSKWETSIGVVTLLAALILLVGATFARVVAAEVFAFVVAAWGFVLIAGGLSMVRVVWPATTSLFFMIPLPGLLIDPLREQLQSCSTSISVFLLQLFGVAAERTGMVIQLTTSQIGVAEACSGLRILVSLLAVIFAVAVLVNRPLIEKLLLGLTAIPIAILINSVRIALVAATVQYAPAWEATVHQIAGLTMILLAIALVSLQLRYTSSLFEVESEQGRRNGRSF